MLLKYFYDNTLAQASYLVGCAATGQALVIDPARDIAPYLEAAEQEGLHITHVTETHIHADFVSGSRELAAHTGAMLYLSDMGDTDWKYAFADEKTQLLRDGERFMVGNIQIEVIATPGHTPEHVIFQLTDTAAADKPMGLFTGDLLFVGSLGRPDLLEEAAGFADTKEIGAQQQFQNVLRLKEMPDYLQIWPGHGAGSACGKSLGAVPSTTLGYEKRFNPAFQFDEETQFVNWLLDEQPEPPRYFAQMKKVNKLGPELLANLPAPQKLDRAELDRLLAQGALVIDSRSGEDFAAGYIAGTLHAPSTSSDFSTYVGWFVDYEQPLYLIADEAEIARLTTELRAIGVDKLLGYFPLDVLTGDLEQIPQWTAQALAQKQANVQIVDVRGRSENHEVRIANVPNIPLGFLPRHFDNLPREQQIVVHCASSERSQIAASLLLKAGFKQVANLSGGIDAWQAAHLPVERGNSVPTHA